MVMTFGVHPTGIHRREVYSCNKNCQENKPEGKPHQTKDCYSTYTKNSAIRKRPKTCVDTSLKKTSRWQMGSGKCDEHSKSLGSCEFEHTEIPPYTYQIGQNPKHWEHTCWCEFRATWALVHCRWECKSVQPWKISWKIVHQFLMRQNTVSSYEPQ